MPRLTERTVLRAKPRATKYEISCSIMVGFLLRVLPSGKKAYYIRYRAPSGKDRRLRIGLTTEVPYAEAVRLAAEHLSGLEKAPERPPERSAPKRRAGPRAEVPYKATPLLADFAARFLSEYATRLKPRTQTNYQLYMRARLIPAFGDRRLDEIQHDEVARFHSSLHEVPYAANACLVLLSSLYSRAIEWKILGRDFNPPTKGIKKFRTKSRERFLSPEERRRLDLFLEGALELKPGSRGALRWHSVAAIRLLSMTGMRRDEVLDLTWDMVDVRHRCFRLPDSKTGQKVVPVSSRVLELVRECRRQRDEWAYEPKPRHVVFSKSGKRILSCALSRTWTMRVRDRIPGFESVRLHDLRHSFASDALMGGVPLAVVGKILGHKKTETTARYAHIADSVLRDAVETASDAIHHGTTTGTRRRKSR